MLLFKGPWFSFLCVYACVLFKQISTLHTAILNTLMFFLKEAMFIYLLLQLIIVSSY